MALYERLELAELISFCCNRGLTLPSRKKDRRRSDRPEIINLLNKADQNRRFYKLFELAPEMRLKIYEFYFAAFMEDIKLTAPISAVGSVPPLCHAARLLRREALPVYFSSGIMLDVYQDWDYWGDAGTPRFGHDFSRMGKLIMTTPMQLFQHVRQVTIVPHFLYTGLAKSIWTIKLDAKTTALRMTTSIEEIKFTWAGPVDGTESEQSAETRQVERGLQILVAEIMGRDGNIRREDMQKILDIFQQTWESREMMLDEGTLRATFPHR